MRTRLFVSAAAVAALAGSASAQLSAYSQDFEAPGIIAADANTLANDGWLVGANVFDPGGNFLYNYFAFPAPNGNLDGGGFRFSAVAVGEGGIDQGAQQMSVFSDYNNGDHGNGNIIESVVFREYTVGAGDVGSTWDFSFDYKSGDITGSMTARAFIKTLDPNNGFAQTNFLTVDTTNSPNWNGDTISLFIDASLSGQIFQIGFDNTGTNFDPSTVFYDNINLVPAPGAVAMLGMGGLMAARRRR